MAGRTRWLEEVVRNALAALELVALHVDVRDPVLPVAAREARDDLELVDRAEDVRLVPGVQPTDPGERQAEEAGQAADLQHDPVGGVALARVPSGEGEEVVSM